MGSTQVAEKRQGLGSEASSPRDRDAREKDFLHSRAERARSQFDKSKVTFGRLAVPFIGAKRKE